MLHVRNLPYFIPIRHSLGSLAHPWCQGPSLILGATFPLYHNYMSFKEHFMRCPCSPNIQLLLTRGSGRRGYFTLGNGIGHTEPRRLDMMKLSPRRKWPLCLQAKRGLTRQTHFASARLWGGCVWREGGGGCQGHAVSTGGVLLKCLWK